MGNSVARAVLSLGLVLLVLSLVSLAIVPPDDPGRVAALIAVAVNLVTVAGAGAALAIWIAKARRKP